MKPLYSLAALNALGYTLVDETPTLAHPMADKQVISATFTRVFAGRTGIYVSTKMPDGTYGYPQHVKFPTAALAKAGAA